MLVRDPEIAIRALLEDPNEIITDSSFLKEYKRIKDLDTVGETKAETHLGTLRIFGIVEPIPRLAKGSNQLSSRGKMLKKLWNEKNHEEFFKALATTILTNPYKHTLFENFLNFVSRAKTVHEIEDQYGWRTGASIVAWCRFSELIDEDEEGKIVVVKKPKNKLKPNMDTIWSEVEKSYSEIRRLGYDKKKLIIKYGDLRFRCALNFHLRNPRDFDLWFCDLMRSKWGQFINLHGTLVGDYDKEENLKYKNRLYPFMSITT